MERFCIDWTAVSVVVAILVFVANRWFEQQRVVASSKVVMEFLAQDLVRLVRQSREMGMYVVSPSLRDLESASRADLYLTQLASQLSMGALERHANELSSLPTTLVESCANCLGGIRRLQEAVELLTADRPVGRHYPSFEDGKHAANVAAAKLMHSAEACLELIDRRRSGSGIRS